MSFLLIREYPRKKIKKNKHKINCLIILNIFKYFCNS